ncbi:helix-turn-helix transcriptional regulator [Chryseobacterium sp. MEBOG07]|uniref:helix-turn-helix transcriptional regulator n=1 Tax=Chryseobacterium sp. MEBOG07 TaxID=2879939 RepID=UPI001F44BE48|nr:AraC family transcriptional regulator [Chryseobacterium sp. MEBOG07]UKB78106.1 AraC family transcriptional regulator [Chryseobacterium sp. MEBOG07]
MDSHNNFTLRKPENPFLSTIVEYYFYIDIPVSQLTEEAEFMIPFPRITVGYFFDHPFMVVNNTLNKSQLINTAISRISTQKINVKPTTDRIKILGAHVRPFGLAYFTKKPINKLPWLINTQELFGNVAKDFMQKIHFLSDTEEMFNAIENVFLDNILIRDLSLITKAIDLIESNFGHIEIKELSKQLNVTDRTLRNHFYEYVGCSPKEYFRVVKLKQIAFQMKYSENSLTQIAHDNNYFDQAHFNHELKDITGQSPKILRKEIPNFRFLQF